MAPATPSRTLPKSNFQQSIASAAATGSQLSASSLLNEASVPHIDVPPGPAPSPFNYPNHVIPPPTYSGIDSLVIVCCHAIFHPDDTNPSFPLKSPHDESNWHLAPFQQSNPDTGKPGEQETFLAHINAGLDALVTGPLAGRCLLVFSGSATKRTLTPLSEARSYYNAALAQALAQGLSGGGPAKDFFDHGRILLEEHATDSFQNLLFSILLFRHRAGHYPKEVCIITHAFKAKRFLELHAPAIRWPSYRLRVQGIDPVMSREELEDTVSGEERFGFAPWQDDPLGTGDALSKKRVTRGWSNDTIRELHDGLEESVKQLLDGTVPTDLPWEDPVEPSDANADANALVQEAKAA